MASTSSVRDQIGALAQDLLNLEIDTILKTDMSGTKMPAVRHALIDIGNSYQIEMAKMGLTPRWLDAGGNDEVPAGSFKAFALYRDIACAEIGEIEKAPPSQSQEGNDEASASLYMLYRIKETSDQIKGVLTRHDNNDYGRRQIEDTDHPVQDLKLTTKELVLVRKAWEIGVERVVAQTIVQIDGDVITRVSPPYARGDNALILKIHHESVQVSVGFWSVLVGLVKDSLEDLLKWLPLP